MFVPVSFTFPCILLTPFISGVLGFRLGRRRARQATRTAQGPRRRRQSEHEPRRVQATVIQHLARPNAYACMHTYRTIHI